MAHQINDFAWERCFVRLDGDYMELLGHIGAWKVTTTKPGECFYTWYRVTPYEFELRALSKGLDDEAYVDTVSIICFIETASFLFCDEIANIISGC